MDEDDLEDAFVEGMLAGEIPLQSIFEDSSDSDLRTVIAAFQ